ncbi:signal transduction phosphohydrolase [Oleiphilus messinensis]|uniref:Signal transduction phosphohydrolase n=1 Tax=Oleiphilus messinensis TaxID=141451 RepID=A0A1Y0I5L6_9GAMM|nr:HDOD domain-containing protein [Oleiphilus messinensis]ARU55778.1 signal transduction phosphohydrolase [Oleiphilus messinensis]
MWNWLSQILGDDKSKRAFSRSRKEYHGDAQRRMIAMAFSELVFDEREPTYEIETTTGEQMYSRIAQELNSSDLDFTSLMPRRPATLPMLIKMLHDEGSDIRGISHAILSDPLLTSRLLQVANSPFFKRREDPVNTVDEAIFVMGKDGVRNLISASIFMPMLKSASKQESQFAQLVWEWALACASAAENLARAQRGNPCEYYLAGLFPALSSLLLYRHTLQTYQDHNPEYIPEYALVYKISTQFVWPQCRRLAKQWSLPDFYRKLFKAMDEQRYDDEITHPLLDSILLGHCSMLTKHGKTALPESELISIACCSDYAMSVTLKSLNNDNASGMPKVL